MFLSLLKLFLEKECEVPVVGTAASGQEAVDLVRTHLPHLAILDLNMPGGDGLVAAQQIRAISPWTRIIVLTAHSELVTIAKNWPFVDAYLTKDAALPELARTIQNVFSTKPAEGDTEDDVLLKRLLVAYNLTVLEVQVLSHILKADSTTQIATSIAKKIKRRVSEDSVKQAVKRIMNKMDIEPRTRVALTQFVRDYLQNHQANHQSNTTP